MDIGKELKGARVKKKITFNKIYEHTRIHPDVLKALEENEYDKILNPTYIRSFLKEYSSYLGLDVNKIIEGYNKLRPQRSKTFQRPEIQLNKLKQSKIVQALSKNSFLIPKWVIILVLAIVVVRGMFGFVKTKVATKASKKEVVLTKTQPSKAKKSRLSDTVLKSVVIPKGKKLILTIDATDDAWLRLKVDGKIFFENILEKGASEKWEANKSFTIWTGKAHALKLNLNGNSIGTAGKGVVKNLVIDRRGIKR